MVTNTTSVDVLNKGLERRESSSRFGPGGAKRFFWHLLQMLIAMGLGMAVYHMLVAFAVDSATYREFRNAYPIVTYWGMVAGMVLGTVALMLYQRSTWRQMSGMTIAMIAPVAVTTVLVICNLMPIQLLRMTGDPLMILAMGLYMFYRPHQHAHAAHATAGHQHTTE